MAEGLSERAACRLSGCPRRTFQYQLRRSDDSKIVERMRAIANERPRFGWRRINVLMQRKGIPSTISACGGSIEPSSFRCVLARSAMSGTFVAHRS